MPTSRLAIAIDGGGTKTTSCIAMLSDNGEVKVVAEATAGASNPAAIGLEPAKKNLAESIRAAMATLSTDELSLEGRAPDRLIAGLAGIEATDAHGPLADWAKQEFGVATATFFTDVELLHFAGRRDLPAIVLIAGTGSVAYGQDPTGHPARTGGRGYLMGDEGSGFWIGQKGLIAATRAMDHAAPDTGLVQRIGEDLGCADVDGWTKVIYELADPRDRIAQMSHRVVEAARSGDAVAEEILRDAGRELAHLVNSVATQLKLTTRPFDLVLAGGVLMNVPAVQQSLDEHLAAIGLSIESQRRIESPAAQAAMQCVR